MAFLPLALTDCLSQTQTLSAAVCYLMRVYALAHVTPLCLVSMHAHTNTCGNAFSSSCYRFNLSHLSVLHTFDEQIESASQVRERPIAPLPPNCPGKCQTWRGGFIELSSLTHHVAIIFDRQRSAISPGGHSEKPHSNNDAFCRPLHHRSGGTHPNQA